jgi:protein-disulfide isomerase
MSSTAVSRRAQRAASGRRARRNSHSRSRLLLIAGAAIAVVAAFVVFQALGRGDSDLPPRVASGEGRVLGSASAPVTVVEYADFQCPVCKRAEADIIARIERDYVVSGQVKIEFRMFPFLGQESFDAAQAAEAAREQGKFWEYHDALYNAQGRENSGAFSYEKLVELARETGLDVELFEQTLLSNKYLEPVQREADGARAAGVASTPTFFVGDEKIVGAQSYDTFQQAIERALAGAEDES